MLEFPPILPLEIAMKFLKFVLLFSLSSVFAVNNVYAADKTPAKPQQKQTAPKEDKNLKEFNRNVGLLFTQRGVITENNKTVITLTYEIENRGSRHIKELTWVAVFIQGDKNLLMQEIPLTFKKAIKPKEKETITLNLPLEHIPQQSQQYFLSQDASISALNVAKKLSFTNGKRIIVK